MNKRIALTSAFLALAGLNLITSCGGKYGAVQVSYISDDPVPTPTPTPVTPPTYLDEAPVIEANCFPCHGPEGWQVPLTSIEAIRSNKVMSRRWIESGLMPPNRPNFKESPEGKGLIDWLTRGTELAVPAYADVQPFIESACNLCHRAGSRNGDLTTLTAIQSLRTSAINLISSGRMPPRNPTWKDMPEGSKVLEWLNYGVEFQP